MTPTHSQQNYIIDVKDLSKKFGKREAVLNVTLQIKPGEIFGFIGPNGAGKTTTIRMLSGLLTPDAGEGTCMGFDIRKQSKEIKSLVGYMTQYFSLYNELTVYENLWMRAEIYGLLNYKKHVERIMNQLGLTPLQHQLARNLSGGWKQRLSLAAALIHSPHLLLLDEPTAGVDAAARRTFWEIINLLSSLGVTILLSSHNIDEILHCHRIAYVSYGQVIMTGTEVEIEQQVGLVTCSVTGPNLPVLMQQLKAVPEIKLVNAYYHELHVCALSEAELEKGIASFKHLSQYQWRRIPTSLEDIFVYLVLQKKDTRYVE